MEHPVASLLHSQPLCTRKRGLAAKPAAAPLPGLSRMPSIVEGPLGIAGTTGS